MIPDGFKEFFQMERGEVEREFAPYFYKYFQFCFDSSKGVDLYNLYCQHTADIIRVKGKKVLDAGCGFGLVSIYLAAHGAEMVSGIDANEEKMEGFQRIISRLSPSLNNIEAKLGDALNLDYEDNYFDAVVIIEAISHVRDTDAFIQEMRRVLAPEGLLYIRDGNNGLNIFQRYQRRQFWRSREYGPVPEESLRGTEKPFPWLDIRREMIQANYPHLDKGTLDFLAKETAGMYGSQIFEAVEGYLKEGRVLSKPSFKFRDPVTGEYNEFEFNPYALKSKLENNGFSAEIVKPFPPRSPYRGVWRSLAVHGLRAFHPLSLVIAPHFEILARKRDRTDEGIVT